MRPSLAVALLPCAAVLLAAAPASAGVQLCWRATRLMWDAKAGRAVPTTPEALARVGEAFAAWEKASGGAVSFRREEPVADAIDGTAEIPRDGCVHAALHGERNFHGELAHGGMDGEIPRRYERGYFFVSRKPGAGDLDTVVHEIGHALGLPHSAVPESVMFSGPRRTGAALVSEQDAADLRARWARGEPGVYAIEGKIVSKRAHPTANVFAVEAKSGRSWSARADYQGKFLIGVGEPGQYRLLARPVTVARDLNPDALGGFRETGRPGVLLLSPARPRVEGVELETDDENAPWTRPRKGSFAASPEPRIPATPLRSGPPPVIRFSFDEGFDDEGPRRLKGTPHGDEVRLEPGARGRALFVGGTKDWLEAKLSTPIAFPRGFTLELWLKRDDWENPYKGGSGWQTVAALTTDASLSVTAPGCPLHKPWAIEAFMYGRGAAKGKSEHARVHSPGWTVPPNRWTHAAMVYDPGEASLVVYLDGVAVDRARGLSPPDFRWPGFKLGTWHQANQAYRGLIDEVEVYDYPRSAADVAAAAGR